MANMTARGLIENNRSQAAKLITDSGLDSWTRKNHEYKQSTQELGNYLSGGQYTSADNQRFRDSANKAIADLDEQLKTYSKSSDEYKQLDSYRNYYNDALGAFDRIDVGTAANDYISADAWHSEDDYNAQKQALQGSIDQLALDMDAIEDKNSADYQGLKSYYDWYLSAMDALDQRQKWDSNFESADDYVLFQNSQDYKNSVQLQKQISEAEARLKEIEPRLSMQAAGGDLNNVDQAVYAEAQQLKRSIDEWRGDLEKMERWQGAIALENLGDFDASTDYEALVDELKEAKQLAKTEEDAAKIDMQLRVLAGSNYDGTTDSGLYDENTYLGHQLMRDFNAEEAQKRIEEIDKELTELGVPTQNWLAFIDQDQAMMSAGSGAEAPETLTVEQQKRADELRREKTDLTKKMNTSVRLQDREKMADKFRSLSPDTIERYAEEGVKHLRNDNTAYVDPTYDEAAAANGDYSGGAHLMKDFAAIADDEEYSELANMIRAAIGAEWLGEDIGFTAQDLLDAYGGQMAQIAGYKKAKQISEMDSDFLRWNAQVLGVGTLAGLNQFGTGVRQFFTDDYIEPNSTAALGSYTREDLSRYGKEQILPGSSQGGSNISQLLFDTVQTTANMLPMIAASYLTQGALSGLGVAAGAAATAGEIVGATTMSLSSAGNSYQQAISEGWNKEDAKMFALITGAAEGGLQYLLGGISGLGGVSEEGLLAAARGLNNAAVRVAAETGIHIASETTEELLQNRLERCLKYYLADEGEQNWLKWDDDDWYTVIITALSTGALEGPGTAANVSREKTLGQIASGKKPGIPSKGAVTAYKQQRDIASAVGGYVKSDEALQYTLMALSEQNEDSESYKLAKRIEKSGKASDVQLGALFSTYLSENGADEALVSLIGGATAYHGIQKQTEVLKAQETQHAEMVAANPEATVLDKTASELTELGIHEPSVALEYSTAVNKILNGQTPTNAEMTKLVGRSDAAKASRVLLSQRNPALSEHLDVVGMKEAIGQIVSDIDAIKKQQAGLTEASVVQAALDAVQQLKVNDATRGAKLDPTKMQKASEDLKKSQQEIDLAKTKLKALEARSFKELAALDAETISQVAGTENVAAYRDLQKKMAELNERADAIQKVAFPNREQRAELVQIRQQQNQIKQQMVSLGQQMTESTVTALKEAAAGANAPSEAAPNTSGVAPAAGDYYVDPTGRVRTREDYIATKTAQGMTEEEANAEFDRDAEMAGGVKHGEQTADQNQERNDLGERGDRAEDRQRGDRSEQRADGRRTEGVSELRTRGGDYLADVSEQATQTDADNTEALDGKYPDLKKLSKQLKDSGFQKVVYVTGGELYNILGESIPAAYNNGELVLRLDYPEAGYSYNATAEHERTHLRLDLMKKRFGEADAQAFVSQTLERVLGKDAYTDAFMKYAKAYAPVYLPQVKDVAKVGHMINEEMLCDMVGGIDNFGTQLGEFQSDAAELLRDTKFDAVTSMLADSDFEGDPGAVVMGESEAGAMPFGVVTEELMPKDLTDPFRNDEMPDVPPETAPFPGEEPMHGSSVTMLSKTSFAEANGFQLVTNDEGLPYEILDKDGNRVTSVTPDMMRNTPLGRLVKEASTVNPETGRAFISEYAAEKEYKLLADAMNLIVKYNDAAVVWELVGSQLFSGIKSNSDTQYNLTMDFGTICRKTQQLVNAMSQTMVKLGRGLSRREVEIVYQETGKAGEATPCPVCYVFSRWMGIGGLLDKINTFQNEYASGKYTQEQLADFMTEIERGAEQYAREKGKADFYDKNGGLKLGKVLSDMKNKYNTSAENAIKKLNQHQQAVAAIAQLQELTKTATPEKAAEYQKAVKGLQRFVLSEEDGTIARIEAQLAEAEEALAPFEAYQWMAKTLMMRDLSTVDENGNPVEKWVINPEYKTVPKDVLFDLNRGADFAKDYPLTWGFRTGKGCAMGKAINPYSDARVGETIQGVASGDVKNIKIGADVNAFLNGNEKERARILASALQKMRQQNLIGGMRFQSTSDFRFEWGSDYLMAFFELQALGANVQLYTKVLEAVDFLASTNADCNLSVMPLSDGIEIGEDGVAKLVYSGITGVNADEAIKKAHQYDNVQLILVGISDEHIRLALAGNDVTFVIPFHGSGQSVHQVQTLMDLIGERLDVTKAQDYSKVQTDHVSKKQTAEQKAMWDLRTAIIMGEAEQLSPEQKTLLQKNPHLQKLYDMFYNDPTNKAYHCFLARAQAEQIFPYEYWDTSLSYDEADQISEIFKRYCESMGIVPRFSGMDSSGNSTGFGNFAYGGENGRAVPGYWKLLIDRKMYSNKYDSEGNWVGYGAYRDQKRINVSNVKIESLDPAVANQSVAENARTKDIHPERTERIVENSVARIEAAKAQGRLYDLTKVSETFRNEIMPVNSAIREAERSAVKTGETVNGAAEKTRGLLSRHEAQGKIQGNVSENDGRGVSDRYGEEAGKEQPPAWERLGVSGRDRLTRDVTDLVAESGTREAEDAWLNAASDTDFAKTVYEQTFLKDPEGGPIFENAAERFVHYPSKLYRIFAQEFGLPGAEQTGRDEQTVRGARYTSPEENRDTTAVDPMEEASEGGTVTRYSLRQEPPPEKTQWGFKLMRVDENGLPHAMFIDAARPYEYGVWYNADAPALDTLLQLEPGYAYLVDENNNVDPNTRRKLTRTSKNITGLPGKGLIDQATAEGKRWMTVTVDAKGKKAVANVGLSGGKNPSPATFAMRPGLHAVDIPSMAHIGPEYKDATTGETKKKRRPDERWFLIEYPVDVDYNQEAYDNPRKDIRDHLPVNGWYSFQTNSGAEARQHWFITGGMKIVGAVTEEDVRQYAKDKGFEQDLQWLDGKSYDDNDGNAVALYEYMKTAEAQPTPSKDEMRQRIEAERARQPARPVIPAKNAESVSKPDVFEEIKKAEARRKSPRSQLDQTETGRKHPRLQSEDTIAQTEDAVKPTARNSIQNPSPDPEHRLLDDLLGVAQSDDPNLIADWVQAQLDKNEQAKENARLRPPPIPSRSFVPKVTDSENAVLDAAIAELVGKTGQQKPSEKNATGFILPKKNAKGQNISRVVQNVGSSEQMKAEARQFKKFALTDEAATYVSVSNEDQINNAKQVIREDGFETAMKNFNRYVNDPTVGFSKWGAELNQQIALGQQLLIEAGVNNNTRACLDILSNLVMLGSQAGQSLQAMRLLKKSGPIGELYYAQKVVDKFNKQYQKLIDGKKMAEITIGQEYADAVVNAASEEEREAALKELKQHIADQLPVTFMDRWNAWRYLSMLGNLRTHIRNVIGNAVFVPLRATKDLMAAGGEYLANKAGLLAEEDRTKSIAVSRDYLDFAKQDAAIMKQELQGNGKYNPASEILAARKVLPGVLDKISRVNSDGIGEGYGVLSKVLVGLEGEDWVFLRPAYAKALAQALQHSGYTVEQLQGAGGPDAAQALNRARAIAIEEAQRATYRDFSAAAAALNRLKHSGGIGGALLEGILPFTKTPINILRRGIEYSPIGVATSVINFMKDVKDSGGAKNADMAKFIDRLSAGMTGSMVMVLGALLARMGWLRGKKDDEKEENFDKLQGYQDYSLQIGDVSLTIDWAAPTALPLFVGAAANDVLSGQGDLKWGDIWDVMMMVSEPMLSLSMLEGLNNVISSASYAKGGQKIMTIAGSAMQSYLGQAFPTLLGQMARSIDGTRRTTYVDKNSSVPAGMQRFIQSSVQNKIPGWESQKAPYVDAWGREDTVSSKFLGALENFLSPSYINMVKSTDVDDELTRLHSALADSDLKSYVLPTTPTKKIGDRDLGADEYVALAKDVGSTKYTLLSQLIYDPKYLALTDEQKAKAIKKIYDYSTAAGRYHVDDTYDIRRQGVWIAEAEAMPSMAQTYARIWEAIEKALES